MSEGISRLASGAFGGAYSFVSQHMTLGLPDDVIARLQGREDFTDLYDSKLYTSYHHEFQHFVQNLSTSYGVWKTLALRSAGSSFLMGADIAEKSGIALKVPFDDHVSMRQTNEVWKLPEHEQAFGIGRVIVNGIKFLEGHQVPKNFNFSGIASPVGNTSVFVNAGGVSTAITAVALLEYQAYTQQLLSLWNTRGIATEHAEFLGSKIAEYPHFRQPQNLVASAFKEPVTNKAGLTFLTYELVTLALSPVFPAPAVFGLVGVIDDRANNRLVPWEHIHPGWRLRTMVDAIREQNMLFPEDCGRQSFIEQVCEKLRWPDAASARQILLGQIEGDAASAPIMSDILGCRGEIDRVVGEGEPTHTYIHRILANPTLRKLLRGPIPTYHDDVHMLPILVEMAMQNYFGTGTCPLCFRTPHRAECTFRRG